ncbi:glycosyltransferase family 2 protein [Flavobacterium sp. N502536]|uniref:glycosyltransferase family 2 protein n=1 Tax=Flavobacterium sp. N502536 TaxID=2986837 RepID=UPI002222D0D6|nr:glycosyltransferase [Flavobacterium sp. N502536]
MKKKPTVSVCMITYGHQNYIREAIEGILMQECNFEVELIIANDCSPDQTDTVIQEILENHPKKSWIKYFRHESNLRMMPNFIFALNQCSGTYIAICEGDDYWIDPLKLQKQVDFLEANPDFVIHSANALELKRNLKSEEGPIIKDKNDSVFVLDDFLFHNNIITCTVLFRNVKVQFPDSFKKVTFGDWFLYLILMNTTKSKTYRSTELFSVYRIHEGGVMSGLTKLDYYNTHIFQINSIYNYLGDKKRYPKNYHLLNDFFIKKFRLMLEENMYLESFRTVISNFRNCSFRMPLKKYLSAIKYNYLQK